MLHYNNRCANIITYVPPSMPLAISGLFVISCRHLLLLICFLASLISVCITLQYFSVYLSLYYLCAFMGDTCLLLVTILSLCIYGGYMLVPARLSKLYHISAVGALATVLHLASITHATTLSFLYT